MIDRTQTIALVLVEPHELTEARTFFDALAPMVLLAAHGTELAIPRDGGPPIELLFRTYPPSGSDWEGYVVTPLLSERCATILCRRLPRLLAIWHSIEEDIWLVADRPFPWDGPYSDDTGSTT